VLAASVSREELSRELAAVEDPSRSVLYRALEQAGLDAGSGPPALLVSDLAFGADLSDLRLLAGLGALAAAFRAPLLAEAQPSLAGAEEAASLADPAAWTPLSPEVARAWEALRRSPVACWIGLALPRVLARVPYGAATDPIETVPFEEAGDLPAPDAFLWSSPAFLCAEAIASAVAAEVSDPLQLVAAEVGDLPFVLLPEPGGRRIQPCVAVRLPDRATERLLNDGFIPLVASGTTPTARCSRLQSIATPLAPLGG
jgi:type VI secretion system protein ImpC